MAPGPSSRRNDRPYVGALAALLVATIVALAFFLWARAEPGAVLVGLPSQHEERSSCLDCHVPFVGAPRSRCTSPGCHGELATGAPPQDGPAMPIRFHATVRAIECTACHVEHGPPPKRRTAHAALPEGIIGDCGRCHDARRRRDHDRTNAVLCSRCHGAQTWSGAEVDHAQLTDRNCDDCHVAPATEAHERVAGVCMSCHDTTTWRIAGSGATSTTSMTPKRSSPHRARK